MQKKVCFNPRKGNFGGIGIVIGIRDGTLTVISPIDGTPAARAGVKALDRIIQIDENSTVNMPLTEAVDLLRGRVGTKVNIRIERANRPSFTVTLKRAIIRIDSVQSTMLAVGDKHFGYGRVIRQRGAVQRGLAFRVPRIQVGALCDQLTRPCDIAAAHHLEQRLCRIPFEKIPYEPEHLSYPLLEK